MGRRIISAGAWWPSVSFADVRFIEGAHRSRWVLSELLRSFGERLGVVGFFRGGSIHSGDA